MKRLPNRCLPERLSVTLYLHRQAFSASPDGVEPVECQCTVMHGSSRSRVELVGLPADVLDWLQRERLLTHTGYQRGTTLNEALRAQVEAMIGRPVDPIPSDRFDEMPLRRWEIPENVYQARVGGIRIA